MAQAAQVIALLTAMLGELIKNERLAASGSAIVPGMLVEESGGEVQEHSGAGLNAQKLWALGNIANGGTIDDAYLAGSTVSYGASHSGQPIAALVATGAPAIVDGDALESAGDGTLRKAVTDAATDTNQRDAIVAYALEDLTNVSGNNARLMVRSA